MNYPQGIEMMKKLVDELKEKGEDSGSFEVGNLTIYYPGFKGYGDYKLTENDGYIPKNIDIVKAVYEKTTKENFEEAVLFLEDVYENGLDSTSTFFEQPFKEKLFWLTLNEEINYPQPGRAGRKLPFMRYFEAALAKNGFVELEKVMLRTTHRAQGRPPLFNLGEIRRPVFYQEFYTGGKSRR
jgi:hypothetical protein